MALLYYNYSMHLLDRRFLSHNKCRTWYLYDDGKRNNHEFLHWNIRLFLLLRAVIISYRLIFLVNQKSLKIKKKKHIFTFRYIPIYVYVTDPESNFGGPRACPNQEVNVKNDNFNTQIFPTIGGKTLQLAKHYAINTIKIIKKKK